MTDTHSIQISVDASSARAELRSLSQQVTSTGNALRQLNGSFGGGGAFESLARGLSSTSSGMRDLNRAARDNGLATFSKELSLMSRGLPVAVREILAASAAFLVSKNALALVAGAVSAVGFGKFASDSMRAGTAALNLKIAVDSVAAGSGEASRALAFVRQTANDLGTPLSTLTKQYANLYSSMRAIGKSPDTIEKVVHGMSTALSALHIAQADQKVFWRELVDTYSIGHIDSQRLIRSMSTHLPSIVQQMQQAMGVTGEQMHHMLKSGGIPLDAWEKLADLFEHRYGGAVKEALDHAQGAVNALSNSFELLRQKSFDSGIDSAIDGVANTLNNILKPHVDSISQALGTAFQHGSAGVQLLMQKLYELRSPLTTIGTILAGYAAYQATFAILGAGVSFLLRPIGLAVAAGALLYATWESFEPTAQKLAAIFQHLGQGVANLSALIADSTKGFINFGAVAAWAGEKASSAWSWLTGGVDKLANNAGYKAGTDYLSGIASAASGLSRKLWGGIESSIPDFLKPTKLVDDYKRLLAATAPKDWTQHGDYESNRKRYDSPNNDLSEEQSKLLAKLSPTTAALKLYREELEKIAGLRGKINPISGSLIGEAELSKLRTAAREDAFKNAFPAANRISEMVDKLRLEQEAIANAGGLSNKETLQQEREFLQIKSEMKKRHVDLTREETDALRDLIRAEHELAKGGSNGFSIWANQQRTSVEALSDNIKSSLDTVADSIAKIAVEGKGKFKSLGEAIRNEFADIAKRIASNFLKAGIRDLMAQAIKGMNLDSSLTSTLSKAIGGGQGIIDKANGELDKIAGSMANTAEMNVNAGIVNLNGATIGASGLDAFKPGTSLQDSINPKSVGGVEKTASASLFAASASRDQSNGITNNSVQAFAQVLARQKGVASDSITRDSVSEFGRIINLQKTQPLAEQIGVKPLADSSVNLLNAAPRISTRAGTDMVHVDSKLKDILDNASKQLPDGWRAQYISGYRHTGAVNPNSRHDRGLAADVQLFDDKGKSLPNYQSPESFRAYESYAQAAKRYQTKTYPELNEKFAWGGYFSHGGKPFGYGAADQMHFDLGGHQGIMGDWQHGLTRGRGIYDTPSRPSVGMGSELAEGRSAFNGNSLKPLSDSTQKVAKDFERNMRAASDKFAPEFAKDLDSATKSAGNGGGGDIGKATSDATKNVNQQSADATGSLTQLGGSIANLATNSKNAPSAIAGVAQSIMNLISQLSSGAGGGGGAGGLFGAVGSLLGSFFEEGGYSGSPVKSAAMPASFWAGAPHYAEGTPNTSGGHPAILHDNEAVVPLSRGREIPVQLNGAGGGGDTHVTYNMHSNISAKDHDSFRRNSNQMAGDFHKMAARMHVRNN